MTLKENKTFTCQTPGRLDRFLQSALHSSRNQVARLIAQSLVQVDGRKVTKAGFKLKTGQQVQASIMQAQSRPAAVDFDVEVLYEDEDILVINKPSGLVVHPAPSVHEATLVDWLKAKGISLSTISGSQRHGIVHRLDKETSGAMVVAKNNQAHQKLSAQLQDKSMGRYYLALIDLELKEDCVIEKPIARNPKNRLKMAVVPGGRDAKTAFKKLLQSRRNRYELIAAKLFTGRTHQIRVHLASFNRHIVGDASYGFKSEHAKIGRFYLHAYILYLHHPRDGRLIYFHAPLDADFTQLLQQHFETEKLYEKLDRDTIISSFDFCDQRM